MKNKRLFLMVIFITILGFTTTLIEAAPLRASDASIQVKINGTKLEAEVYPALINGRILVPMRALFESLGAKVVWDAKMGTVAAVKGEQKISIQINSKEAWINDKKVYLEIAPMILDSYTMVPLRFISESMGEKVEWEESSRTVYIGSKTPPVAVQTPQFVKQKNLTAKAMLAYRQDGSAMFKPGVINMRDRDYVKSGTLAEDSFLLCNERRAKARFLAGTQVTFNEKGYVENGTLAADTSLEFASLDSIDVNLINRGDRNWITLKKGIPVNLNLAGYVTSGTLAVDCPLPYSESAYTNIKADYPIKFRADGKLALGTLAQTMNYSYVDGVNMNFEDGKPIEFYDRGSVKSAYLLEDEKLSIAAQWGNEVEFKKGNQITFHQNGYVSSGMLKNNTGLAYRQAILAEFKSETPVVLYESGYVKSGTLAGTTSLPLATGLNKNYNGGSTVTFDSNGKVI